MTDKPSDVCVWTYHERHYEHLYISWYTASCFHDVKELEETRYTCPSCGKPIKIVDAEE